MSKLFPLSRRSVAAQLRALGVRSGGVLLAHTSFRSVRPIQGGPAGLIEAFREALGPDGTLVAPSWTGRDDEVFDPRVTPSADDLGVTAQTFWRMPGVLRSEHAFAFAALGPQAERIVSGPLPVPPHTAQSPVGRVHELDGQILLLGVGHDANTTLHLAELLAGVPYGVPKSVRALENGRPVRVDYRENDHCCERFALMDGWLRSRDLQSEGQVGHAHARLADSRAIVRVALDHLAENPLVFLHEEGSACPDCRAARKSIAR